MVGPRGSLLEVSYTYSEELGQDVRNAGPALEEASFKTTVTSPPSLPPVIDLRLLFLCSCVLVPALIVDMMMMMMLECTKFLSRVVNSGIQGFRYKVTWYPRDCFLFHHQHLNQLVDIDTLSLFILYPYSYFLDLLRLLKGKRDGLKWVFQVFGT
jgi:hypothetical protein